MKKSLIALAVLAASGAAMAQSSVTLYGRVDASLGVTKDTVGNVSTTKLFNGSDAGLTGSRWGMKGTEDLGGGLKAEFVLESRFNVDTGLGNTELFGGDAFVGLNGGFGKVQLGRTYTAYDAVKGLAVSNSVFDSAFTPNALPAYTGRGANQIKYVSPSFSGFTVAASTALSEVKGTKNTNSVTGMYAAGPLKAGLGFEASPTGDNTVLSAAYDFGVAAVSAGYGQFDASGTGDDANGLDIGVTMPVGAFKFSVGYATGETETQAGAKVSDIRQFGLGATYSLSKRTTAYAGYVDKKTENAAGVKINPSTRLYAVGLRHDF